MVKFTMGNNNTSDMVQIRTRDKLVLKIKAALDTFAVEGDNIVMLRTIPGKDGMKEKSIEAVFNPEWIHEIDLWYESRKRLINFTKEAAEYKELSSGSGNNGD